MRSLFLASLFSLGFISPPADAVQITLQDPYQNVYGKTLGLCNRTAEMDPKWPTTGYLRDNKCTFTREDAGSHYVCVDLRRARITTDQGVSREDPTWTDFWTETGQAKSADDAKNNWPKPGPWCICMWAFARMYGQHPDFENMIDCSATNRWVVDDYKLDDPNQCRALAAVCRKCDVTTGAADDKQSLADKCTQALTKCA